MRQATLQKTTDIGVFGAEAKRRRAQAATRPAAKDEVRVLRTVDEIAWIEEGWRALEAEGAVLFQSYD